MSRLSPEDIEWLEASLDDAERVASLAEAQGVLCGLLCAGAPDAQATWIRELALAEELPRALAMLERLALDTREALEARSIGPILMLPGEDEPLAERALGLADFCRGFVYGLGLAGLAEGDLAADTREIIVDFGEIQRMDPDGITDGDDNEEEGALTELVEFVRVSVMLVYEHIEARNDKT